jgi:hypothetical protein
MPHTIFFEKPDLVLLNLFFGVRQKCLPNSFTAAKEQTLKLFMSKTLPYRAETLITYRPYNIIFHMYQGSSIWGPKQRVAYIHVGEPSELGPM